MKSCSGLGDLPADEVPEAALLGRSNVGKSSLLNVLAGQHQLARTSRTPGRTRLLNLFDVNGGRVRLVDCPGYGYAKVARSEREGWGELIEPYLAQRPNLRLALLLVDATLPAQPPDLDLHAWLALRPYPTLVVATKCDRLSGNQRPQALARLKAAFGEEPLPFSAITRLGRDPLRGRLLAVGQSAPTRTPA
ncbi:MAG TPA: ribosome biogenesis GTP-binding protein YihA/YsxC [Terriglobales bacterium]|nr:ribosome biogenesis GTP-binding protein YihA/YsxC [Terriglobales bacterium]